MLLWKITVALAVGRLSCLMHVLRSSYRFPAAAASVKAEANAPNVRVCSVCLTQVKLKLPPARAYFHANERMRRQDEEGKRMAIVNGGITVRLCC